MNQIDVGAFLVAGILGVVPGVDGRLPWVVIIVWALLKLLKVL